MDLENVANDFLATIQGFLKMMISKLGQIPVWLIAILILNAMRGVFKLELKK